MAFGSPVRNRNNFNIAKKNQKVSAEKEQEIRNSQAEGALQGERSGSILSGTPEEQQGQLSGLNLANVIYGQGLGQTGQDVQNLLAKYKERTAQSGADPVSSAIMGQKAEAVANAQRQSAQQGAKGASSLGAIDEIGRKQNREIASSLYGQAGQAMTGEKGFLSNIVSGSTSLMQGEKAANTKQPTVQQDSGLTVICTELYRQGIMPLSIYSKDQEYGLNIINTRPEVIIGYHSFARPIVKLMKKSKLFTKIIAYPAMKWAKQIANEESSIVGKLIVHVGEPMCGLLGKAIIFIKKEGKYV